MGFETIVAWAIADFVAAAPGFFINFAVSQVASAFIASAFGNDTKRDAGGGFINDATGRQQMVRTAIANRRVIYGEVRVSGPIVYASVTGIANENLHFVIPFAGHECEAINDIYLNEDRITPANLLADGNVATGKYSDNFAQFQKHLGTTGQAADTLLASYDPNWTTACRGEGVTYLYARLYWSRDVYPTGIPNVSAIVRGKKVFDPRNSTTRWSQNWALCVRDYLVNTDYGLGCGADEIDDATFIAAANICDERVAGPVYSNTATADPATDVFTLAANEATFDTNDGVRLTTTGTLPAPLLTGTTYYYIRTSDGTCQLATTELKALTGVAINITDAGSGTHTLTYYNQSRYTMNGTIDTGSKPLDVIRQMVSAGGGRIVYSQGRWKIYAGAYRAQSGTLTVADLAGELDVIPRIERKSLFNGVRGTYVSPYNAWQPADFPPVKSATYAVEDGSVEILRDIDLPFTTNAIRAQRLAKLILEKARLAANINFPAKYTAFKYDVADTVGVTIAQLGLAGADYTIENWKFEAQGGVTLVLQREAAAAYAWSTGDAQSIYAGPNSNLPDPLTVVAPGAPTVSEALYQTSGSAGVKTRITVSWAAPEDIFVASYEPAIMAPGSVDFTALPTQSGTAITIEDAAVGAYAFRVRAINSLGVRSAWSPTTTRDIFGLTSNPTNPAGFSVIASAGFALGAWTLSEDLDVRIGGRAVIRHQPVTSGAAWSNGTVLQEFNGDAVTGLLPLITGTYMLKFRDSSGNYSQTEATFVATEGLVTGFTTVTTITESTTFTGTKTQTIVDSSTLKLDNSGDVDSVADFDAEPNIDSLGGIYSTGTYLFNTVFDGTTVAVRRFEADLAVAATDEANNVDDWPDIDDVADVDGGTVNDCDVTLYAATTNDNPAGSPTWSAWTPFMVADFNSRGAKFKLEFESGNPTHNIAVSLLAVAIKIPV